MTVPAARSGGTSILAAVVLIALAAGGYVGGFVPLVRCPDSHSTEPHDEPAIFFPDSPSFGATPPTPKTIHCARCSDEIKVTLFNRWFRNSLEGKPSSVMVSRGFRRQNSGRTWALTGIRIGQPVHAEQLETARGEILKTGNFETVTLEAERNVDAPGTVKVVLTVQEKP